MGPLVSLPESAGGLDDGRDLHKPDVYLMPGFNSRPDNTVPAWDRFVVSAKLDTAGTVHNIHGVGWPGGDHPAAFPFAQHTARRTAGYLAEYIYKTSHPQRKRVLVSHSLGGLVIGQYLNGPQDEVPVHAALMLGPAIDADSFYPGRGEFSWALRRHPFLKVCVVISSNDRVLQSAYLLGDLDHDLALGFCGPRPPAAAGQLRGGGAIVPPNQVQVIDASAEVPRHDAYNTAPLVRAAIHMLIGQLHDAAAAAAA
jgi:hypothetical protein